LSQFLWLIHWEIPRLFLEGSINLTNPVVCLFPKFWGQQEDNDRKISNIGCLISSRIEYRAAEIQHSLFDILRFKKPKNVFYVLSLATRPFEGPKVTALLGDSPARHIS
jgi:hypothetical protein